MEESKATELRDSRAQQRDVIIRLKKKGDRREQKKMRVSVHENFRKSGLLRTRAALVLDSRKEYMVVENLRGGYSACVYDPDVS